MSQIAVEAEYFNVLAGAGWMPDFVGTFFVDANGKVSLNHEVLTLNSAELSSWENLGKSPSGTPGRTSSSLKMMRWQLPHLSLNHILHQRKRPNSPPTLIKCTTYVVKFCIQCEQSEPLFRGLLWSPPQLKITVRDPLVGRSAVMQYLRRPLGRAFAVSYRYWE